MGLLSFLFGKKKEEDFIVESEDFGQYEHDNREIINFFFPNGYKYYDFKHFDYQEQPAKEILDFSGKPECPTCKTELEKLPKRKTKCKNCGNFYYHKYFPLESERKIINEEENRNHEKLWQEFGVFKTAIGRFSRYSEKNIWEEVENMHKNRQTFEDIILNFTRILAEKNTKQGYYSETAWILGIAKSFFDDIKKPNEEINKRFHFFQLIDGYFCNANRVKINSLGNFSKNFNLKNEILNPQLPHKNCPHGEVCECVYAPDIPMIFTIGNPRDKEKFEKEKTFILQVLSQFQVKLK